MNDVTTLNRNNGSNTVQQQRKKYNQMDGSIPTTSPEDQESITSNNTIVRNIQIQKEALI